MVFPLPDGPATATNSPAGISSSTLLSTSSGRPPLLNVRVSPWASIIFRAFLVLSPVASAATLAACSEEGDRPGTPPVAAAKPSEAGEPDSAGTPRIVFIGTSLTAGYGLDDPALAYPALLGRRIAEAGHGYRVVNAGVSGDTSAGGRARLASLMERHGFRLAVLFVELGANDGLRGQSPEALRDNLGWIIRETRRRHPGAGVVVAGMRAPTNLGTAYTEAFRTVYPRIAEEHDVPLIPFLLEGVAAVPSLNQPDGIHPNAAGHEAVADHVWSLLGAYLAGRCELDGAC